MTKHESALEVHSRAFSFTGIGFKYNSNYTPTIKTYSEAAAESPYPVDSMKTRTYRKLFLP